MKDVFNLQKSKSEIWLKYLDNNFLQCLNISDEKTKKEKKELVEKEEMLKNILGSRSLPDNDGQDVTAKSTDNQGGAQLIPREPFKTRLSGARRYSMAQIIRLWNIDCIK